MLYHGLDTRTIVEPALTSAATPSASNLTNAPDLSGYFFGQQSARRMGCFTANFIGNFIGSGLFPESSR